MGSVSDRQTGQFLLSVGAVFFFLSLTLSTMASADVQKTSQATIDESIEALWTDQAFSPELQQRQQRLRNILEKGAVSKADLEEMIEKSVSSIIERKTTTRYIVQDMPKRVNELLSPYLEWEDVRKQIWKVGSSAIEDGRQVVISIATLAPAGTPWLVVPEKLVGEIEELTDNKFTIRIYSGGVMGEDTDILRKMDVGQLDGGGLTALGILTASPEATIFLLPGLFESYDEVDYIFKKFRKRIDKTFEERGYILSSLIDTGYFHIFSKNKISSLADIRSSKMLTWSGIVETTLFDELGISAMPVSVTEIISALSTGMADTNVAPAAWMLGMQAYQYANYFVKEPLLYSPGAAVVSTKTRDRLQRQFGFSDTFTYNVQELLIFEFSSLEDEWKRQARRYEERCMEAFVTRVGMKPVTLPPEDRKALEEASKRVWTRLADEAYPKDFLNDILIALDKYRQGRQ